MGSTWYQIDKALFLREVRNMEREGFALDREALRKQNVIAFEGEIIVGDEKHKIRFVYPDAFPYRRPKALLPDLPIAETDEHRSLVDGSLCLMGYKPDQWDPEDSGTILIEDVRTWIISSKTGKWESEHDAPDVAHFPPASLNSVLLHSAFREVKTPDVGALRLKYSGALGLYYPIRIFGQLNRIEITNSIWLIDKNNPVLVDTRFFALGRTPLRLFQLFSQDNVTFTAFLEVLKEEMGMEDSIETIGKSVHTGFRNRPDKCIYEKGKVSPLGIVYPVGGVLRWQFFEVLRGERPWRVVPTSINYLDDLWNRTKGVMDVELLKGASALVLGLGAIGSTVSVELGAAGVGTLTLVDNDIFKIGNLSRHEGDMRHLGWPKHFVMEDIIRRRFPFIETKPLYFDILTERSLLESLIAESDVVVVCIGNHNTHLYINEICQKLGKPAIYAFVGVDASAGRVQRVIPGETGCYFCMRRYMEHNPGFYYTLPEVKDVNMLPLDYGCNAPAYPGTSFDTKTVALAQSRLIVQTLLRGRGSYPDDKKNFFLVTNREIEEIPNSSALWSTAWNIPIDQGCHHCNPQEQKLSEEDKKRIEELLEDKVD